MIRRSLFTGLLIFSGFFYSCKKESAGPEEIETEEEFTFTKEGELSLLKPNGDTVRKLDIEIAEDRYDRETGLMYRESMEELQGMLFIFEEETPRAFYMKNTYIPLDIIYYSADSTAVSYHQNAVPEDETPLPSEEPAQFVLEINAGLVEEWNIEIGDKIYFERTD